MEYKALVAEFVFVANRELRRKRSKVAETSENRYDLNSGEFSYKSTGGVKWLKRLILPNLHNLMSLIL